MAVLNELLPEYQHKIALTHRGLVDDSYARSLRELGVSIEIVGLGRRRLDMDIGSMHITVYESHAQVVTEEDKKKIMRARDSYEMWRGFGLSSRYSVKSDSFDGWGRNSLYNTFQYWSEVQDQQDPSNNLRLTMRSVKLRPPSLSDKMKFPASARALFLPEDITLWNVRDIDTGNAFPLWEAESEFLRVEVPPALSAPEDRVLAISRSGIERKPGERDERGKAMTPIAFAAINLLTFNQRADFELVNMMQNEEFRDKVLTIKDSDGSDAKLGFVKTADTLKFPPNLRVELNKEHPTVRDLYIDYPGYWTDNSDRVSFMRDLAVKGVLTYADLQKCLRALCIDAARKGNSKVIERVRSKGLIDGRGLISAEETDVEASIAAIEILADVKNVKFFVPILRAEDTINGQITGSELRRSFIDNIKGGPYSTTISPEQWVNSNIKMLQVAQKRFGS